MFTANQDLSLPSFLCPYSHCGCRAERDNGGGFVTGFVVGGAIFGALGFLFAPQISAALLNDEQRLRLPKFLDEEEKSPEATKQVCRLFTSGALLLHGVWVPCHNPSRGKPLLSCKAKSLHAVSCPLFMSSRVPDDYS